MGFSSDTFVRMADGNRKSIVRLKQGDLVQTINGISAVICKTIAYEKHVFYQVYDKYNPLNNSGITGSDVWLSGTHPIYLKSTMQYIYPMYLTLNDTKIEKVIYNLLLDNKSCRMIRLAPDDDRSHDIYAATYAHGLKDGIIEHDFYGTNKIVDTIYRLNPIQFENGLVNLTDCETIRDKKTGWVIGLTQKKDIMNRIFRLLTPRIYDVHVASI